MICQLHCRASRWVLASTWLLWVGSTPVRAQFAVIDVASVAQLIQQAQTLAQQLEQARAQVAKAEALYQSLTGSRGMQQLLSGTVRNYLPADWPQLMSAGQGSGSAYGALAADVRAAISANAILSVSQLAVLPAGQQAHIAAMRTNVALLQGLTQQALINSSGRFSSLQQLIQAIPAATDQKGILDLQARIGVEQGMLQNEQTKLQTLYQAALSQSAALQQQEREQVILGYGDFATRFQPSPY